jgi:antitoxin component HigA of HigAB toxin-antitoxin module
MMPSTRKSSEREGQGNQTEQERLPRALKEIEGLMHAKRNALEGDRLGVLVALVEAWEAKYFPLDLPDPIEAIKYHMSRIGLAGAI